MKILSRLILLSGLTVISFLSIPEPVLAHPGHGNHLLSFSEQILTSELTITGLILALLFGAVHGLTPGHGKTIATAYLVGSNSTLVQAFFLSIIVTLTHTLGIFALGLAILLVDRCLNARSLAPVGDAGSHRYLLPEQLYYIFTLLSGIAISVIGFWQLESYFNSHQHEQHEHQHLDDNQTSNLISLGIAGGLIPCSEALILLLGAIALHRAIYGLELVAAFSLGLGLTLMVVGAIAVYCQQWLNYFPRLERIRTHSPLVSAALISVVGLALTIEAII